jgi:AraC-like DNA-binding protein
MARMIRMTPISSQPAIRDIRGLGGVMPTCDRSDFEALARSRVFADFAASLRRLTGLPMALNNPEVTDTRLPSDRGSANPLCRIIRKTPGGVERCCASDRRHHARAAAMGQSILYTCHAGFIDMAVPIFVAGRHVATISCGQVLTGPPSDAAAKRLRERLRWLPIDDAEFLDAYRGAPYLPRAQVRDVMRLLELFAGHLCESARRIRELEARLERGEIRRAREFVEREFGDPDLSLAGAAAAAGLSPAHFSNVFHRSAGVTFTRFVQARRAAEARRLLETTGRSITDICFDCGFNSLTHFNRVFRRFEHCSPREFRARVRRSRGRPRRPGIPRR